MKKNKIEKKSEKIMIKDFEYRIDEIEQLMSDEIFGDCVFEKIYRLIGHAQKIKNDLDVATGQFIPARAASGMYKRLFEILNDGFEALPIGFGFSK